MKMLYQDALKRHYQHPIGQSQLDTATHQHFGFNGNCGDEVTISIEFDEKTEIIISVRFESDACAICTASASLLCQMMDGQTKNLFLTGLEFLTTNLNKKSASVHNITNLEPLLAIASYPSRIQCALLPWETALQAFSSPIVQLTDNQVTTHA